MSRRADQKQAARVVRQQLAAERRRTRTMWITFVAVGVLLIGRASCRERVLRLV